MTDKRITLLGVNHKTTPLEVREKMALTAGYEGPLASLKGISGLAEYFLLSTCNRVELLFVSAAEDEVEETMMQFLFGDALSLEERSRYSYVYHNEKAVNHIFQVAASLDSLVVGEAQILGQLKEAYRHASQIGSTGPMLNKLMHKSFSVAKRVRSETGIGSSAVSISYAAVQLAKKIFGQLDDKKVLLVGAGEMAELAAEHLVGQGVGGVVVANRTLSRAVDLAKRFNGKACVLEELTSQLEHVDIIISSTGSPDLVITAADVKPLMRARRNRPLFFIDIAVPRDLDSSLNELDDVFLYDIDDLSQVVEMNRAEREKEAVKASRIVDEEALKFVRWQQSMMIIPTIAAMRQKVDEICRKELAKTFSKLDLSEKERNKIEKMTLSISAKMLHDPLLYLKGETSHLDDDSRVNTLKNVFGLKEDDPGKRD